MTYLLHLKYVGIIHRVLLPSTFACLCCIQTIMGSIICGACACTYLSILNGTHS